MHEKNPWWILAGRHRMLERLPTKSAPGSYRWVLVFHDWTKVKNLLEPKDLKADTVFLATMDDNDAPPQCCSLKKDDPPVNKGNSLLNAFLVKAGELVARALARLPIQDLTANSPERTQQGCIAADFKGEHRTSDGGVGVQFLGELGRMIVVEKSFVRLEQDCPHPRGPFLTFPLNLTFSHVRKSNNTSPVVGVWSSGSSPCDGGGGYRSLDKNDEKSPRPFYRIGTVRGSRTDLKADMLWVCLLGFLGFLINVPQGRRGPLGHGQGGSDDGETCQDQRRRP